MAEVRFDVDKGERLFEKHNKHAGGHVVVVISVFVNVALLRKRVSGVRETCQRVKRARSKYRIRANTGIL